MLIYVACWPILAWLAGELIPNIGKGNLNRVLSLTSLALFIFLIQKFAQFIQDIILAKPALKISQYIRCSVISRLQKIELLSIERLSSGDITYRLTEDADRVGEVIYKLIQDTTPSFLQLIIVFSYMVFLDWKISVATLILVPLIAMLVNSFGSRVLKAAERSQNQISNLAALLNEYIQGLPLIRAYAAENWMLKRLEKEIETHRIERYRTLKLIALQHPVIGFIEASGILTVLALGAARIQSGGMDAQSFSSYIAALLMLIDPISHLTTNYNEFKQGEASLKRLFSIEREPLEIQDCKFPIKLKKPKGDIYLNNVSFSYDQENIIIRDLNINILKGQVVALVGPSGSGKSTIFALLMRFLKPKKGTISFDDINISNLRAIDIRKHIALVPQKAIIFSGSISEAISFGRKTSKEEIIKAAKIANAHEFIMQMPNGYKTLLEERGSNFSGGQLQRIAIARALVGNPSVLLLDEATSALDSESEASVQVALSQAMKGRTVLVIAHRLSTVQEADKIIVLENGSISEQGTHDELISKKGRYKELCSRQLIRQ